MTTIGTRAGTRMLAALAALALGAALGGCGARSDAERVDGQEGQPRYGADGRLIGAEPGLGAAVPEALGVRVLSDVATLATGSGEIATITALVTDTANNALAERPVSFRATGGVLQGASAATDANGEASARLGLLGDHRNQDIVVSVSAGDARGEAIVRAGGSELVVNGPSSLAEGAEGSFAVVLRDGTGEPIRDAPIALESDAGNTVTTPGGAVTDADGRVEARVGSLYGDDTLRATALEGTLSASHAFGVSSDTLAFDIADGSAFAVGATERVEVTWTSGGRPVAGRELRFTSTAGRILGRRTTPTDEAGKARATFTSGGAGPVVLGVADAVDGDPQAHVDVGFVATVAARITLGATSTHVPTGATSVLTARVVDAGGNPVANRGVAFTSDDLQGGRLDVALARSDARGRASVTFTAGADATPRDGVEVRARVEGTALAETLSLSVVESAPNVILGTANRVLTDDFDTQYHVPFVVQVSDGRGVPLEGADVSLTVRPLDYGKGALTLVDGDGTPYAPADEGWTPERWALAPGSITCPSEDTNGNRVLDAGEDTNGNGALDPQDPASLTSIEGASTTLLGGTLVTDASGSGHFRMLYPASTAGWARVEITARVTGLGVEATDAFETLLGGLAEEAGNVERAPANAVSPYGTSPDCAGER